MVTISADAERRLITDLLRPFSVGQQAAAAVADDLVEADLRGHDSHGLARLNMHLDRLRTGSVKAGAVPVIERELPGAIVIDGAATLGPPAMHFAIDEGVRRAKTSGSCTASIREHGYIAYLGRYVERGLDHDCICILVSKSRGNVHPYGGMDAAHHRQQSNRRRAADSGRTRPDRHVHQYGSDGQDPGSAGYR